MELDKNELIKVYNTSKMEAIQMLDWWEIQRLQWAWPSQYPPMEGWVDHLRYKKGSKEVVTENWPISGETPTGVQVSEDNPSGEDSEENPLTTPPEKEEEIIRGIRRGIRRGNSPEHQIAPQVSKESGSGENPSPSPTADPQIINRTLIQCLRHEWGRVPAKAPDTVIEREPNARELAQMRDLGKELSARGGVPLDYIKQAFREAAGAKKLHISYVRAVLLAWLGIERNRSP